ncbi:MAG: glycosyltransferase family 4 protein [Candidatus Paceibacterota bacterium]
MKILFLINELRRGGAQRAFVNQINYLAGKGNDVCLAIILKESSASYLPDLILDKNKIYFLSEKPLGGLGSLLKLNRLAKKEEIEIIYSTLEYSNIIARLAKLLRPKLRIFIRESNIADKKTFLFKAVDMLLNFLPEKIIAVSEAVKESLKKYQPFYASKIVTLYNGVVIPTDGDSRASRDSKEVKILNVGGIRRQKDQLFLLEVFKKIIGTNKKVRLFIVGDGPERRNLENFIIRENLGNFVKITGRISDEKILADYYRQSDIFALSSLWEGCPNALLEAMAYGLAPVSTEVGGATEIIEDGKSGFLVPVGDKDAFFNKINILINNSGLRNQIGREARNRVKNKYSLDKQVDTLFKIFNI